MLTPAQLATLKAAILADAVLNAYPNTTDGAYDMANTPGMGLQAPAAPVFTVWKSNVGITDIGNNFVATELAGLSSLNATRLQTIALYSPNGINPAMADRRAFFDDIYSGAGGTGTRAKLLILWKRLANKLEKIFATGTGSDASPATMTIEGVISYQDVLAARNS